MMQCVKRNEVASYMMHEDISHLINCIAITLLVVLLGADDQRLPPLQNAHKHRLEGLESYRGHWQ